MPKNRKARVWTEEKKLMTPKEIDEMGCVCAREGCSATFKETMPPDWRNLLIWWSPKPINAKMFEIASGGFCDRDAVLCPEHFNELDGMLKDLARWTGEPVAGEA